MHDFINRGGTLIIVSHNSNTIQQMCDRTMILFGGEIKALSNTVDSINTYYQLMECSARQELGPNKNEILNEVELKSIKCFGEDGKERNKFETGESVTFRIEYKSDKVIKNPNYSLSFNGNIYTGYATEFDGKETNDLNGDTQVEFHMPYLGLGPGLYNVSIGVWDKNFIKAYYWNWNGYKIIIDSSKKMLGRFSFEHKWEIKNGKSLGKNE
ncbi:MAG: Wzt carbohydrate-binding domain-containing protein, partial [Calditrichia bacterium]|nr:Wzt carbohydrate-binding domain-containing protein [Calditrichia bacterium]